MVKKGVIGPALPEGASVSIRAISSVQPHGWLKTAQAVEAIARTRAITHAARDYRVVRQPNVDPNDARDRVIEVYRSASDEILVLGRAAALGTSPEQRRALLKLRDLEMGRRDLARRTLEANWGIRLNPENEPTPHLVDLAA